MRSKPIIALLALLFAAYSLFEVKYRVQNLRRELVEMNRQMDNNREAMHVLKAEWAYLNKPERLRMLAEKHLALVHPNSKQMVSQKNLELVWAETPETKTPVLASHTASEFKPASMLKKNAPMLAPMVQPRLKPVSLRRLVRKP